MPFKDYELLGSCKRDFDTEIRYCIASMRVEKRELVELYFSLREDGAENSRLIFCISKILSSMKKSSDIEFYVKPDDFANATTGAEYIMNKYSEYITDDKNKVSFFVKL